MKRKILTAAALIILIFMFTGCASASINLGEGYYVPENFSSVLITSSDGTAIQNAVERIQSGGTILLSGDFVLKENINIKKNLKIKGNGDKKALLKASESLSDGISRIIRCQGNITLENLKITGGKETNGGGVKLDGGEVNIISCDIIENTAILGGGGIHSQANKLTLINCNISGNTTFGAGGGLSAIGGTITMTNCIIDNNTAGFSYGGGLGISGSTVNLSSCTISNNKLTQPNGGGIALINQASLTSKDCTISGNRVPEVYSDEKSTKK